MIIKGYRVYPYRGQPEKRLFVEMVKLEMVKLEQFPNLIFIKNKKLEL
jgi:hypothetical protein